ncbi:MAG: hypothetical protein EZS28_037754, partial [Streblomastix strix]
MGHFSPAALQRCMTCYNPPVIPEQQAARFYVIRRMAYVVVDSIQCWWILACESCLAYAASCRQKQFSVERTILFFDVSTNEAQSSFGVQSQSSLKSKQARAYLIALAHADIDINCNMSILQLKNISIKYSKGSIIKRQ